MATVTGASKDEHDKEFMEKKGQVKPDKTPSANIKSHIDYWQKNGDYKDITPEGAKAAADGIGKHHLKGQKPSESKLNQISAYGKSFEARNYFKTNHIEAMHGGGVMKPSGNKLNPDQFTNDGHKILTSHLSNKL